MHAPTRPPCLQELKLAHENLIAWMSTLHELTFGDEPRLGQLETVRWFLGKARRDRRVLVEKTYAALQPTLTGQSAADVAGARSLTLRSLAAGSQHIARWSRDAIAANWARYCEETRKIRDLWMEAIEAEQGTLYPLLEKADRLTSVTRPVTLPGGHCAAQEPPTN